MEDMLSQGIFYINVECVCGNDNVECIYDSEEKRMIFKCMECGRIDYIELE